MYVEDNDILYHQIEVINDWLYLTGKTHQQLNYGKEMSNLNYSSTARTENTPINISIEAHILAAIKEISRNNNRV